MPVEGRIYLDNAATSWPKPATVYDVVDWHQRHCGAPAGRSTYREAEEVERRMASARQRVARLIGADDARRIIFTCSGTDSLNLALRGLLRSGDHVVTSVVEHNSVLRPLKFAEQHLNVSTTCVDCGVSGVLQPDDIARAVTPRTRLISLIHGSNVTGALQPLDEVARIAREKGVTLLVDAAQTLGHIPLNVRDWQDVLLAAPAHKGLLAPLGLGLLYIAPGLETRLEPLRLGGTGTQSESDQQPTTMPDRYESGNHNVPAILGLDEGLAYLESAGAAALTRLTRLEQRLRQGLQDLDRVVVYASQNSAHGLGLVSCNIEGYDPREVATMLDAGHRIQVRAGFHCAPRMHRALGTDRLGGAVRFSLGLFNTEDEIEQTLTAVREIVASATEFY